MIIDFIEYFLTSLFFKYLLVSIFLTFALTAPIFLIFGNNDQSFFAACIVAFFSGLIPGLFAHRRRREG